MSQFKTTMFRRNLMEWSPYVRLAHDFSEIRHNANKEKFESRVTDHALHYFFSGCGEYSLDGKSYRIEPGSVFIVRPGHDYCFKLEAGSRPHMLNIHFDLIEHQDSFYPYPYPKAARRVPPLSLPDNLPGKVVIENRKSYENVFFELYSVFLLQGEKWEMKKKSLMFDLLGIIYDNATPVKPGNLTEHRAVVQKSLGYIYQHLHRKLTLNELVKQAGVCRALYIRIFKAECGLSPIKFVYKAKIEKAKNELASGNLPIKEIAASLGFADVYHFSRIFKEFIGHPPGRYKKIFSNEPYAARD